MVSIGEFRLETVIQQSAWQVVYRGKRASDGLPVVAKATRGENPNLKVLIALRHEYALLRELDLDAVPRALALEPSGNGLALVEEDAGIRSLSTCISEGLPSIASFLRAAAAVTRVVEVLHRSRIIHKDIKPEHFFLNEDGSRARIIDFGIATRLSQENHQALGPDSLEGTLAYMSPEQTGRMNRVLDRRSDLYSLGATLYELLTRTLPFDASDPLELVHAHIAKLPTPPHRLRADVPPVVSDIIMKLLAKMAEDRYQDAGGLLADLERCLAALEAGGEIATFPLGQQDTHHELRIPQKLYGRETDAAALLAAFERARAGEAELLLIAGHSGTGKSALVNDIQKQLARGGHFIAGKFDQLNRNVPYAPIAHACGDLIRALLTESTESLAVWKEKLLVALGPNGQVLVDVVPELALVIGPQPGVPALGPSEAQHRFELVAQSFFKVFASAQHPLVLFLDDLQWADAASLGLLELLLTQHQQRHMLVIGSYRDNEVTAVHPLTLFLDEVQGKVRVGHLALGPLELEHVSQLLADTLGPSRHSLRELAAATLRKTQGNPFFVSQFLARIFEDGLLVFDTARREWAFDVAAIEAAMVTDNVVDFLVSKLRRLSASTQRLVQLGACIGHDFDARTLAVISEFPSSELRAGLWEALSAELLVPTDQRYRYFHDQLGPDAGQGAEAVPNAGYRFLHDRVQQAAYAMIHDAERARVHLQIGRLMLADAEKNADDARLFDIVGHMNIGRAHIEAPEERLRLAQLGLRAGKRARDAAAPAAAIELLEPVLELLGAQPWATAYETAYQAHLTLAECAYLTGNHDKAQRALAALEQHARSVLERVAPRNLEVSLLTNIGRLADACAVAVDTIRMLGVDLPSPEDKAGLGAAIGAEFGGYQAALAGRTIESLAELPAMTDPTQLALIATFAGAIPCAFQANQELMVLVVLKAVALPLRHGSALLSPFFYTQYGVVHSVVTGDRQVSYRFGQLGIQLAKGLGIQASPGPVHFLMGAFVSHWCAPIAESLEHLKLGLRLSFEQGDLLHAGYCMGIGHFYRLQSGENLDDVEAELGDMIEAVTRRNDVINQHILTVCRQTIAALKGRTAALATLTGAGFDEAAFEATAPPPALAVYGAPKAMVCYLAGRYREALAATETFHPLPGLFYHGEYKLFHALALIELSRATAPADRPALLARVREDADCLKAWAANGPANHAHRHALVLAQLAVLEGNQPEAMALFQQAIDGARESGFAQHLALSNELCGRFHLEHRRRKVARSYLEDARYGYERWGATAKAAELAVEYEALLETAASEDGRGDQATHARRSVTMGSTTTTTVGGLDIESAMRATKAIASELVLDRLVDRLMRILIENAGAQRGFLIIPSADRLMIRASIDVQSDVVEPGLEEDVGQSTKLATQVVQYVAHSHEAVVLGDAAADRRFANDPYVAAQRPKSILCLALLNQGQLTAVLYLENNVATDAFSPARIERIGFIASHAAVALENAKLYGQVRAANETLEHRVVERTRELAHRNRDMRLVLDNVNQGLVTVDIEGRLARERSSIVDSWFGAYDDRPRFSEFCARFDPTFAEFFELGLAALVEGILPPELCLAQLPARMKSGTRELRCTYFPIALGGILDGLLIVINDITEELRQAREEAEQKEQLAVFQAFARDRGSFLTFFEEGQRMMRELDDAALDAADRMRFLHTLKGNSGAMGLALVAELCHEAESLLAAGALTHDRLEPLRQRWQNVTRAFDAIVGTRGRDVVEVSRRAIDELTDRIRRGAPAQALAAELAGWQLEPVEQPLRRLAEHGRELAARLGKVEVGVEVDGNGVRVRAEECAPLWSSLVHVVRNAVDHGLETPDERRASNKVPLGRLRLRAMIQGPALTIEIEDDGRGIDWDAVRRVAERRGMACASREDLVQALFSPDVTTRTEATGTSGRGAGLAALHRQVQSLGGTLQVESEPGAGARWRLSVPCSVVAAVVSGTAEDTGARTAA